MFSKGYVLATPVMNGTDVPYLLIYFFKIINISKNVIELNINRT